MVWLCLFNAAYDEKHISMPSRRDDDLNKVKTINIRITYLSDEISKILSVVQWLGVGKDKKRVEHRRHLLNKFNSLLLNISCYNLLEYAFQNKLSGNKYNEIINSMYNKTLITMIQILWMMKIHLVILSLTATKALSSRSAEVFQTIAAYSQQVRVSVYWAICIMSFSTRDPSMINQR